MKKIIEQVFAVIRAAWIILTFPFYVLWWEAWSWYTWKIKVPRMLDDLDRMGKEYRRRLREGAEKKK